jgi:broad specificity phosphatase PhoE
MPTTLYLIRHAATANNLAHPAKLQGRAADPPLHPVGVRQATMTRDHLAIQPIEAVYSSPLRRAVETASILAAPHRLTPILLDPLTECDVGRWEEKTWDEIKRAEPDAYARHHADQSAFGYPGGENFAEVHARAAAAIEELFRRHVGEGFLVVSHHVVNRVYLAGLLGLPPGKARAVSLANCGVSVVVREGGTTAVRTLNATAHLYGAAA